MSRRGVKYEQARFVFERSRRVPRAVTQAAGSVRERPPGPTTQLDPRDDRDRGAARLPRWLAGSARKLEELRHGHAAMHGTVSARAGSRTDRGNAPRGRASTLGSAAPMIESSATETSGTVWR